MKFNDTPSMTRMTTETEHDLPAWQRRWAADHLNVAESATPEEARRALARLLNPQDFVPSVELQQSFYLLTEGKAKDLHETDSQAQAFLAEDSLRRGEVESFVDAFWTLEPA